MSTIAATPEQIKPGDVLIDQYTTARVMAVADGYLMARRPHCTPFVLRIADVGKAWRMRDG